VIAIAGAGGHEGRLVLAPIYIAVMILVVRPLLRRLADAYRRAGRLTPAVLAAVLIGLLLSSYATDWMGVKYIFGAFLYGMVMPVTAPLNCARTSWSGWRRSASWCCCQCSSSSPD